MGALLGLCIYVLVAIPWEVYHGDTPIAPAPWNYVFWFALWFVCQAAGRALIRAGAKS